MTRRRRSSPLPILLLLVLCCGAFSLGLWGYSTLQNEVVLAFGPSADSLSLLQRNVYAFRLLSGIETLTIPADPSGSPIIFHIDTGEAVGSITSRLEAQGLIMDRQAFRDYLVYKGYDTRLQPGGYQLSPSSTPLEIAHILQDENARLLEFNILPGWRIEEIAASLPTSGLEISPEAFTAAVKSNRADLPFLSSLPEYASLEGFLFPEGYAFTRSTTLDGMLDTILARFEEMVYKDPKIIDGLGNSGLSLYEGVILASIVQREAVVEEEQGLIASVFLNRLRAGIKLDSDPTVQYALGIRESQNSWWPNPLFAEDLVVDSPYNTYLYPGLPPGPIANPGLSAIRAVAFPDESPYFYFRARCDGSGRHTFAETYEEHLQNACP